MSTPLTQYIADTEHYTLILEKARNVRRQLWIGTADIKDLHIKLGTASVPFLKLLSDLIRRGVEIRLIHAKEPGENFRKDFDKYPLLNEGLERILCNRVHFKLMIFDLETVYIGSANLTGAGMGMKSKDTRNFEAGILTDNSAIVEQAINQFDNVWIGKHCKACKRKGYCIDRIGI